MNDSLVGVDFKCKPFNLPKVSDKDLVRRGKGWYWDAYYQSFFPDWEVVVTPEDNRIEETDPWEYGYGFEDQCDSGYYDYYAGGSGSTGSTSSESQQVANYQAGVSFLNKIGDDIEDGDAVGVRINSDGEALADAGVAVLAQSMVDQWMLKTMGDVAAVRAIGTASLFAGTAISGYVTYVGMTDGEVSAADVGNAVSTLLGAAACVCVLSGGILAPAVGLLTAGAIIVGYVANFLPSDSQGSSSSSY